MKFVIRPTNKNFKLTFLILLLVSFEVLTLTNKSNFELQKLEVKFFIIILSEIVQIWWKSN